MLNPEGLNLSSFGFYFDHLVFDKNGLRVHISNGAEAEIIIAFEYVRSFLFFKESDLYSEISKYEHEKLVDGGERTLGVFQICKRPLLGNIYQGRLDSENPRYFWISTPDECLEIIAFDDPKVTGGSKGE